MVDKYDFLTDAMRVFDELERLRAHCSALEREQHEFKVSDGSGELTESVRKVYEYGKAVLANKCFNFGWYSIGVRERDDGGIEPKASVDEWAADCFRSSNLPKNFSAADVFTICDDVVQRKYDETWERERADWLDDKEGDGDAGQ